MTTTGERTTSGGDVGRADDQRWDAAGPSVHTGRVSLSGAATRAWQIVGVALAAAILTYVVVRLRVVVVACLLAVLIAATLGPLMGRLVDRGWRRSLAALALTVGWIAVVVAIMSLVGWRLAVEIPEIAAEAGGALDDLRGRGLPIPESLSLSELGSQGGGGGDGEGGASPAMAGLRLGAEVLAALALAVVLSFFLLRDGHRMWHWSIAALGPQRRRMADRMGREAYSTVAEYVRGLSLVATADALLSAIGLFALGVPLASVLAVLTFFGAFVPTLGAFVVGGLAVLMALATGGASLAVAVAVMYTAIQQIDSNILQPWVMGQRLPLHPAVVLLALATGGILAGVVGALMGVPIAAAIVAATRVYLMDEGSAQA